MERFGLEPIISHYEQSGGLRSIRDVVLGTQVKLSRVMSPRLSALLDEAQTAVQWKPPVDLFVAAEASINAFASSLPAISTSHTSVSMASRWQK